MGIEEIKKYFFRKPKIELEGEGNTTKPAVPEKISVRCTKCKQTLLQSDLSANLQVCPKCGFHHKIGARERILGLCDEGSFTELFSQQSLGDATDFEGYEGKLNKAREESGELDGVVCGSITLGGAKTAVFCMEHRFMMGSMGSVVGEKITALFEYATQHKLPVIGFILSGGARMQEGIISLMQMAKTSGAVGKHSAAKLLYIAVLTNPTTGGVSASFAFDGDVIVAEPAALIGFAGPRVIEQTIRQKLPPSFQTAEFLLEKGFIDVIIPRTEQKQQLSHLLTLHGCLRGDIQ